MIFQSLKRRPFIQRDVMLKLLIADDETDIRELLRLYLEKDGYHVLEAADGQSALSLLEQESVL